MQDAKGVVGSFRFGYQRERKGSKRHERELKGTKRRKRDCSIELCTGYTGVYYGVCRRQDGRTGQDVGLVEGFSCGSCHIIKLFTFRPGSCPVHEPFILLI